MSVEKYHSEAVKNIFDTGVGIDEHTKKAVQMHLLARNFASQLTSSLASEAAINFGETFRYRNVYCGKTKEGECVTIEKFIDGKFRKYLNNTGLLCGDKADPLCQKAKCLAHFSQEKSKGKILLVDIQGGGFEPYDPEVAC